MDREIKLESPSEVETQKQRHVMRWCKVYEINHTFSCYYLRRWLVDQVAQGVRIQAVVAVGTVLQAFVADGSMLLEK